MDTYDFTWEKHMPGGVWTLTFALKIEERKIPSQYYSYPEKEEMEKYKYWCLIDTYFAKDLTNLLWYLLEYKELTQKCKVVRYVKRCLDNK